MVLIMLWEDQKYRHKASRYQKTLNLIRSGHSPPSTRSKKARPPRYEFVTNLVNRMK